MKHKKYLLNKEQGEILLWAIIFGMVTLIGLIFYGLSILISFE